MNDLAASRRRLVPCPWTSIAALGLLALLVGPAYAAGPDVTVFSFTDFGNYGASGGFVGYAIGTRSCNRGDKPLNWCDQGSGCAAGAQTNDHPVIAQNLYRLKDGRFDQIGMSWLKHGFLSTNSTTSGCAGSSGQSCIGPPAGSNQLGIGCTDPYSSSLNGSRPLGRRSEVDATTGDFPFPPSSPGGPYQVYDQRIKVSTNDVDSTMNPGALYFAEAQYIAPDDAAAGNGLNNASYRRVTIGAGPPTSPAYALSGTGTHFEGLPAILAWPAADNTVELVAVDVPGSAPLERFHVARKVTDLGGGNWHYEYAVHNLNSDRSANAFRVDFPDGTTISNTGFKGVDHHSGEPYETNAWLPTVNGSTGTVTWATDDFATDPNANALRWATMFNFWYDANQPPGAAQETLTLFKPGSPSQVAVNFGPIFADGFESGNTSSWDPPTPGPFAPPASGY